MNGIVRAGSAWDKRTSGGSSRALRKGGVTNPQNRPAQHGGESAGAPLGAAHCPEGRVRYNDAALPRRRDRRTRRSASRSGLLEPCGG